MAEFSDKAASVAEFRGLREATGLGAFSEEATRASLEQTLHAVWMRDAHGTLVAMGRVIGDGACFAQVTDIAVHPDLQGRGLGREVVHALCAWIDAHLPQGCYVSLIADPGAERLYAKFGFEPRFGMARTVK